MAYQIRSLTDTKLKLRFHKLITNETGSRLNRTKFRLKESKNYYNY